MGWWRKDSKRTEELNVAAGEEQHWGTVLKASKAVLTLVALFKQPESDLVTPPMGRQLPSSTCLVSHAGETTPLKVTEFLKQILVVSNSSLWPDQHWHGTRKGSVIKTEWERGGDNAIDNTTDLDQPKIVMKLHPTNVCAHLRRNFALKDSWDMWALTR